MNDASPTKELRNNFCDSSVNERKPNLENMGGGVGGYNWHVVPAALLMSLECAFDLEGGSITYPCDNIKIITPWI